MLVHLTQLPWLEQQDSPTTHPGRGNHGKPDFSKPACIVVDHTTIDRLNAVGETDKPCSWLRFKPTTPGEISNLLPLCILGAPEAVLGDIRNQLAVYNRSESPLTHGLQCLAAGLTAAPSVREVQGTLFPTMSPPPRGGWPVNIPQLRPAIKYSQGALNDMPNWPQRCRIARREGGHVYGVYFPGAKLFVYDDGDTVANRVFGPELEWLDHPDEPGEKCPPSGLDTGGTR